MNILRPLKSIPKDKLEHAQIGTWFTMLIIAIPMLTILGKLVALVVFAYAIEISQRAFGWGKFEHLDALAVVIGGLPVLAAYMIGLYFYGGNL